VPYLVHGRQENSPGNTVKPEPPIVSYTAIRAFLEKMIGDQKTAPFFSIGPSTILFEDENEDDKEAIRPLRY
jgi:hypothetical protein